MPLFSKVSIIKIHLKENCQNNRKRTSREREGGDWGRGIPSLLPNPKKEILCIKFTVQIQIIIPIAFIKILELSKNFNVKKELKAKELQVLEARHS